ncbi:TatD family hydrolase [Candidatus Bathyarchaeota archaeon]|nr:TatD family hydrolase [Candidatus Bathyarchaeota archaeon]
MKFVDAHVHLSDKEYAEDIDQIIAEAKNFNIVALVSNSMSYETSVGSARAFKVKLNQVE